MTNYFFKYELNPYYTILCFIFWVVLLIAYRKSYFLYTKRHTNWIVFGTFVTIFCVFALGEWDTYYYHGLYDKMVFLDRKYHVEDFYFWLIRTIPFSYYLWRLAVWGSAVVLMAWTFKLNKLNNECVAFLFVLILLQQFSFTRASLGVAMLLFAVSLFLNAKTESMYYYVFAIAGCIASYFLHKSMPLFLLMSILALCPINKTTFWALVIAFPILRMVIIPFVMDFIASGYLSEKTTEFAESYLDREKIVLNFKGLIQSVIKYAPLYITFFILIKEYIFKKIFLPPNIRLFFHLAFILFYISSLFLGQETSNFVTSRTEHVMFFPLTIVMAYYMTTTYKRTRSLKFALFMFALSTAYYYAYNIWKHI
ncbi:MAG: EpsG family protein [Muribaculaceae bacterium]